MFSSSISHTFRFLDLTYSFSNLHVGTFPKSLRAALKAIDKIAGVYIIFINPTLH